MTQLARELFPTALDFDNVCYWSGLRPTTPSNVPLIGRTKIQNLYLNTGHGTLGWTMGVGSGRQAGPQSRPAQRRADRRPPACLRHQLGRASERESVCQYVSISVVDVFLKNKQLSR